VEEELAAVQVVVRVAEAARDATRGSIWDLLAIVCARNAEPLPLMNRDIPATR
jgi:hypothetical protein